MNPKREGAPLYVNGDADGLELGVGAEVVDAEKDGGELYLKPLNSRYPIKPLGRAKVVGVVREFSKRFR